MRFLIVLAMFLPFSVVPFAASAPPPSQNSNSQSRAVPAGIPPAPAGKAPMNAITQTAANAGVRVCLPTIEKIGNFVTANTRSRGMSFLPAADADRQIASASYEIELPNQTIAYATMSAAPTRDGNCDALYETVTYWNGACADVAAKVFPQAKLSGALQQQILVLQGGPSLRIFLMPAGTQGCVAIKKEVIY